MRSAVVALVALACGGAAERAPEPEPPPSGQPRRQELVRLTLLADVNRVAPGQEVTVAADRKSVV